MLKYRWYLVGVAVALIIVAAGVRTSGGPVVVVDLAAELSNATERQPSPEAFHVVDVGLAGATKRSIYVTMPSRLVWEQVIPDRAWLSVSLGVREEAWVREGHGVLFVAGISHEGKSEELVSLIVNPYSNHADRQWLPLLLDLSPWAGERVALTFETKIAHAEATPANHLALWGTPAIVTK